MVGRLVEKQDIGISEKCLGKEDLDLLGTVEVSHLSVVILGSDAETVEQHCGIGLCLVSVHLGEFALKLTRSYSVLIGEVLLHIDGILFLHDVIEALVTHDDGIHYGIIIIFEMVLFENGKTLSGCDDYLTFGSVEFTGKDLEKCGLACSVGSDETVAVALRELDIDVFEKSFLSDSVSYING